MTQTRGTLRTVRRSLIALLIGLAATAAAAQGAEPLVVIDLPDEGPQHQFGDWLQSALSGEQVRARWSRVSDTTGQQEAPACIVTWSDPQRGAGGTRRLRGHVRDGGGIVYVVGEGTRHVRRARTFLGPLDVNVTELDGGASSAQWASHPLTDGSPDLGAVIAGSSISGVGGSPLIRSGGRQIATAFDWGPLGRAVILDQSVLFDQLHAASPRPAVRDFLVRATLWAARAGESAPDRPETAARPEPAARPEIPSIEELLGQEPASPVEHNTAVLDLPDDDRQDWGDLRDLLRAEVENARLEVSEPTRREGEPLLDAGALERAGLLVIGSGREGDEVHWSEPLSVGWFFSRGGRILAIPHAAGGTMGRMVGLNKLLTQLRIAASLERENGQAQLVVHPITRGIRMPEDGLRMRGGAQVWAPLTDSLVTVRRSPAAVAWQSGEGRIVVIDGQLLLAQRGQNQPYPEMVTVLRNSIQWLMGEL